MEETQRHQRREALRAAFPATIPVMTGFLCLGIAYGVLMQSKGYGPGWSVLMSAIAFGGSMQFVAITLLTTAFDPIQAFLLSVMVNARHMFYGLSLLDKYKGLELEGRLKGYDFGGMTRLAVRDGKEIKKRTKELMTSLINGALQRKQVIFPSDDLELEDQFTTHTYTLRDGKIIYSKGNDHIIDAVRCAMLIREEGNLDPVGEEVVSLKPVLTNPVFI